MAHKTNNPIQELGDQPFEQMLRRHLQRSSTTVGTCSGFDAETTSAYLERALHASAQQAFETHLADCGACRQHVVALARLNAELTPAPAVVITTQPIPEPFWTRWTAQATAWWHELSWNWSMAGAGAMASVVIAALSFYGWQQSREVASSPLTAANVAVDAKIAMPDAQPIIAGNAEAAATDLNSVATPMNAPVLERERVLAKAETSVAGNAPAGQAPTVPALPQFSPSTFAAPAPAAPAIRVLDAPQEVIAFNAERPSAPVVALPSNGDFFGNTPRQGGLQGTPVGFNQTGGLTPVRLGSSEPPAPGSSLNLVKDQLERQSTLAEVVTSDTRLKRSEEERKDSKSDKSEPGRVRVLLDSVLSQGRSFSFTAKQKDAPTKEAEKTAESPVAKPLTKQVNGHTLYFERGIWIDENYKANLTLPLIKLTRGTQRYQQVLIDNPMLEEFFQLAPVIVVWKGKIYEVRKNN